MAKHVFGTPEHWRSRAEECRTMAEWMINPETRAAMLRNAADYEELAKRAEDRDKEEDVA